jgi:hypothetical protein
MSKATFHSHTKQLEKLLLSILHLHIPVQLTFLYGVQERRKILDPDKGQISVIRLLSPKHL